MSEPFSLKRLLDFAISRERESVTLYKALAQKTSDLTLKKIFNDFVAQEKQHEIFYTQVLNDISKDSDPKTPLDEESEYTVYMRNLMDDHITSLEITGDQIYSMDQALDFAIAREKNSILFFSGLKNYIPDKVKPTLDIIIKEEMRHAALLTDLKLKKE
jgi:rubrerythrin